MPRKDRVKPTHYPILPFHALRTAQLISAIIVSGIMSYFLWELHHDKYKLPWTFILLLTVSLLTILSLTATIILHCFHGLNPLLNTILNSTLSILWSLGFSLLAWWSSGTLAHICNRNNWDDEAGVSICRIYKALFSFSLFGLLATILALVLDIHVQRNTTRRGKFTALQNLDHKRGGGFNDVPALGGGGGGVEANPNPMARGQARQRGGEEYAALDEHVPYDDDTTYHGASGQVGRRSLEDRI